MPIEPYGGTLVNGFIGDEEWQMRLASAKGKIVRVSDEDLINGVNVITGCYSPLTGFMTEQEYREVVGRNKLPSGLDWTIPILLHVEKSALDSLSMGAPLILADQAGEARAVMELRSVFTVDRDEYNLKVFGSNSSDHPGVQDCLRRPPVCVGGPIRAPRSAIPALRHFGQPDRRHRRGVGGSKLDRTGGGAEQELGLGQLRAGLVELALEFLHAALYRRPALRLGDHLESEALESGGQTFKSGLHLALEGDEVRDGHEEFAGLLQRIALGGARRYDVFRRKLRPEAGCGLVLRGGRGWIGQLYARRALRA